MNALPVPALDRSRVTAAVAVALFLVPAGVAAAEKDDDVGFVIVVNEKNPIRSMPGPNIGKLFKKKLSWSKWNPEIRSLRGQGVEKWVKKTPEVIPIEQESDSPVRRAFSREILKQEPSQTRRYWQRQIFSGNDTPGPTVDSDAQVLNIVRNNPGAVGYVSPNAELGKGVRVLVHKFKVVKNRKNPHSSLAREEIENIFLRKTITWKSWVVPDTAMPAGKGGFVSAQPVDNQVAYRLFTREVLEKSPRSLKLYWQRKKPNEKPPMKDSDAEVLSYVGSHPGAIGYVADDAELGARVSLLKVE